MKNITVLKERYLSFIAEGINRFIFRITLLIFFITVSGLLFLWNRLPPQLPLYYSKPWGHEQIGTPRNLLEILTSVGMLFLINVFLAVLFHRKHRFFSRMLFLGGVSLVMLMIFTVIKIVLLII